MNPLDIFFLVIIVISTVISLFRGIVIEIFSILSIIGGIIAANLLYQKVAIFLTRFISSSFWANIIAFAILFIVVCGLINLLGVLLQKTLKKLSLGWLNRVAGVVFGFLRGVIIVVILMVILTKFPIANSDKLIASSQIIPYLYWAIKLLLLFLPPEFASVLEKLIHIKILKV